MSDLKGKCVGFDIGSLNLHIAVREGGRWTKAGVEPLPEGLVRDGQILSYEAMTDFLKRMRKRYRLPRQAAVVLPAAACYCRSFTTAYMTDAQLRFNLPYEFRDYITGDKENYFFDYAVVDTVPGDDGAPRELELMAAAAARMTVADYLAMFRRAGFTLKAAVPVEMAYINLLRTARLDADTHPHCLLDLGHDAVRLYMFDGDRFDNLRALDYGCGELDRLIAEHFGVDIHVAASYRMQNYADAAALPECAELYNSIGVEVLKAVNYQRFNSGGRELDHIHCCGGGVLNPALMAALRAALPLPLADMSEFWPDLPAGLAEDAPLAAAAMGAVLQ